MKRMILLIPKGKESEPGGPGFGCPQRVKEVFNLTGGTLVSGARERQIMSLEPRLG